MKHRMVIAFLIAAAAALVVGCSSLPGLRVLTGQDDGATVSEVTVESLDLVMADKSGTTDPALIAAADRIETAALGTVDIIEIRSDFETRIFTVDLLFRPPQTDGSLEGQIAELEALRRALEVTWVGTMRASDGMDVLRVKMLQPASFVTLDNGESVVGLVFIDAQIERGAAAGYLAGARSLNTFFDLVAGGVLALEQPEEVTLYEGSPNHPMFMLFSGA